MIYFLKYDPKIRIANLKIEDIHELTVIDMSDKLLREKFKTMRVKAYNSHIEELLITNNYYSTFISCKTGFYFVFNTEYVLLNTYIQELIRKYNINRI